MTRQDLIEQRAALVRRLHSRQANFSTIVAAIAAIDTQLATLREGGR